MNAKTNSNVKRGIVNFFGGLGYLSVVMQWLWTVLLYFSVLQALVTFISPDVSHQIAKPIPAVVSSGGTNIFLTILTVIIVTAVLALTIYLIYKVPATIVKSSKKVVHEAAESAAPLVIKVQHKRETKKVRLKLTFTLILIIKTVVIILPVILTYSSKLLEKQSFDFNVALVVSLFLAGLSFVFFVFQYLSAVLLKIKKQEIW